MKKIIIMVLFLGCTVVVLSSCGSKCALENAENIQNDNIMMQESEISVLSDKDTETEGISIKEDNDHLTQEVKQTTSAVDNNDTEAISTENDSEDLMHNTEKTEDMNSAMENKSESHESETVNSEKMENSNANTTLEATIQSDITKITVTNGSTGEKKDISGMEEVNVLLTQIRNLNIISQEEENIQGYSYSLALYRKENLVQIIYVNGESIGIDGTVYSIESSQNIIESIK